MQVEIVSHCWRYTRLLIYQLSSLVLYPPRNMSVTMTVFYSDEDPPTSNALSFFESHEVANVTWRRWPLPKSQLFRRAIGRDLATRETKADWLWFADCDMCFGEGALDALGIVASRTAKDLLFPRSVLISKSHQIGDQAIERLSPDVPQVMDIVPQEFERRRYRTAIGGVQIIRGHVARTGGYCRGSRRWQRPAERWQKCQCDVAFRKMIREFTGGGWERVDLPNVFRIRHSQCGREDEHVKL